MGRPLHVLIVEDSEADAQLMLRELERSGYDPMSRRVETSEAMESALKEGGWDIVLSDYSMPHFSAPAALKLLQKCGTDLPFIIVSGNTGEDTAVVAMKAGAHDYIMKNNLKRLVPAIEREVAEAHIRQERKQAEEELVYLASYPRLNPLPVIDIDPTGRVTFINESARQQFPDIENAGFEHPYLAGLGASLPALQRTEGITTVREVKVGDEYYLQTISFVKQKQHLRIYGVNITERKRAEERVTHLTTVLKAIRNVNQLIAREKDRESLIQEACDLLIRRQGYEKAWILLLDENKNFVTAVGTGLGENASTVLGEMRAGNYPTCLRELLDRGQPFLAYDQPGKRHKGCILAGEHSSQGVYRCKLEYGGKLYGVLGVTVPSGVISDKEEQNLFLELCGDIAFALANIEREEGRKRAEEQTRGLKEYLQLQVDRMPIALIVWDTKFRVQTWNPSAERIFGFMAEEALGKHPYDIIVPKEAQPHVDTIWSRLLAGDMTAYSVNENITKDGRTIVCDWANTPFKEADGTVVGVLSIVQDITELKKLEKKVTEYGELNKLKSDLLSMVSHELRTPLAIIKGYSTMLVEYDQRLDSKEKSQYLIAIDQAADRLTHLVDQLLDMSRMEAGLLKLDKVRTSITALIKDTVAEAKLRTATHIIVADLPRRLPLVEIDVERIREVLDNLIDNAMKYSDEGTEVKVSAQKGRGELIISVTDQGRGIPGEELPHLFNRMHHRERKLRSSESGLGLGLSICKGLVEAHGGRIWSESEVGKGSTFYFTIPFDSKGG